MNRRELCRALGAAVASPALSRLPADQLWAAGRRAHRALRARAFAVLDQHQAETVAALVDLIIPETDTPGARAAGVPQFIDLLLGEWASDEERAQFLAGLTDVDTRARTAHGTDFLGATEAQRVEILKALEAERPGPDTKPNAPPPFFHMLKFVTVYGYCTSQVGATTVLRYETIPSSYEPCTSLDHWRAAPGDF